MESGMILIRNNEDDKMSWMKTKSGIFSIKSPYASLARGERGIFFGQHCLEL